MIEHDLRGGDCLAILPTIADNSIDSVVTDPPYHLKSIVKRFANAKPENEHFALNKSHSHYMSRGFMGKTWDGGDIAQNPALWSEVLRVLKPGGHCVAFSGTRTYHRMACAIEDAGFEVRDQLAWVYGQGFPKSHAVDKHIDREAHAVRPRTKEQPVGKGTSAWKVENGGQATHWIKEAKDRGDKTVFVADDTPITDAARQWEGWGTALKPAWEPICLARKPLSEKTVAANVLLWGTGAINVDGCRVGIGASDDIYAKDPHTQNKQGPGFGQGGTGAGYNVGIGRWPANLCHDGSQEVLDLFPETGKSTGGRCGDSNVFGGLKGQERGFTAGDPGFGDSGSAARFFYCAKASKADRAGSKHPTVKPIKLMQWLCRMVTPPGGRVLDPFAGSGTTGVAAIIEGFRPILIERETEYIADIKRRLSVTVAA